MHDPIWKCRDGREMKIGDMTDSHLANCIAKILRSRKGWRREYLDRLQLERVIRSIKRAC
jgi:hypothetical protein